MSTTHTPFVELLLLLQVPEQLGAVVWADAAISSFRGRAAASAYTILFSQLFMSAAHCSSCVKGAIRPQLSAWLYPHLPGLLRSASAAALAGNTRPSFEDVNRLLAVATSAWRQCGAEQPGLPDGMDALGAAQQVLRDIMQARAERLTAWQLYQWRYERVHKGL